MLDHSVHSYLLAAQAPYLVKLNILRFMLVDMDGEMGRIQSRLVGRLRHKGHHLG